MPIKSKSQARFMYAAANNPEFAKKADIKPSVAKEFIASTSKSDFKKLKEKINRKTK